MALPLPKSQRLADYGLVAAGIIISIIPAYIVFIFFQCRIIKGMTEGELKDKILASSRPYQTGLTFRSISRRLLPLYLHEFLDWCIHTNIDYFDTGSFEYDRNQIFADVIEIPLLPCTRQLYH